MPYDGRVIANFVLDYADRAGWQVTNLKLQKLVYFCHVWSLIEMDCPLIRHKFEAWQRGPVLPYLYREFKHLGDQPIRERALALDAATGTRQQATCELDDASLALLGRVLNFYGRLSAAVLVEMTHTQGGPWHKVWHHKASIAPGMKIDDADIARFYRGALAPFPVQ